MVRRKTRNGAFSALEIFTKDNKSVNPIILFNFFIKILYVRFKYRVKNLCIIDILIDPYFYEIIQSY